MARILRGDVIWADLNPVRGREQAGLSPVLVISHDVFTCSKGVRSFVYKFLFLSKLKLNVSSTSDLLSRLRGTYDEFRDRLLAR